ncbi:hypothetical protein AEM51_08015 [Bacteroidetes bacterium UKL13-3]|nr:hypothetical protein AEM51_08015 [Bacteroidetes bacterium UKL13-3]HCP94226.1 lipopolysaccharide biosynthesis protein [Bacteroidota bacterium]
MSEQITSDEITLRQIILRLTDWYNYFKSKWVLILICSLIGACIGFIRAYVSKPIYTAELTFALEEKGTGSSYSGIASQLGIELGGTSGGGAFSGENNIELIKSRYIIEKALLSAVEIEGKRILLINRYLEYNKIREEWEKSRPDLASITFTENEDRAAFGIKKDSVLYSVYKSIKTVSLSVAKVEKKLSIISVKVKSPDELFAKYFTEVLVNAASNMYIESKTQKSKRNLDILEARLDSVKRQLDINIYGAASTKDQNINIIRAQGNVSFSKKQLNVQILTTMYGELIKNTEIAKYTLMREEPLIQIIDRPIFPLEKVKKGKLTGLIGGGFFGLFTSLLLLTFSRFRKMLMNGFLA